MKPKTVVLSLPVADLERALRFYRDGLGLSAAAEDEGAVLFELPNLSLFLIEREEYATYTDRAGVATPDAAVAGACVISCAIGSRAEVDDILARATAAGGSVPKSAGTYDGSYMGYFTDPDGHLWELVSNPRTQSAAAPE
ncbi:VOC family protein [Streptomyces sp. NBC_00457]|uniref:VOC family protein n=1 Tax=Streptomyces sp. NBC_00457 TaxID=2975748 RepID=UPI002E236584